MSAVGRLHNTVPACRWREYPGFPDLARLHALHPARYPHLLESVARGAPQARYDILFAFPQSTLRLTASGQLLADGQRSAHRFLDALDRAWRHEQITTTDHPPLPFSGGWFLYLGYELAGEIESGLRDMPADPAWPIAMAQRIPAAIIRDHHTHKTWLVTETDQEALLPELEQDLRVSERTTLATLLPTLLGRMEEEPAWHRERVRRTLDYIRAGDTFQVNLSRAWRIEFATPPAAVALYARLRETNPAPFAGLATLDAERAVVSSSPERLVAVRNRQIHTRPIAGTRPRSRDAGQDRQQRAALVANPKERAEHIMLVDLERNDLGRVCVPGSVKVDELLVVESYQHVHHLVSNVSGRLRPGTTPGAIIRALFPGGTITGCPKVRTMQIIAELEDEARCGYTGSMGYLNRDGSLDLNILIRTLLLDRNHVSLRAGGGIVADSDPDRELEETRAKARGLLAVFAGQGAAAC